MTTEEQRLEEARVFSRFTEQHCPNLQRIVRDNECHSDVLPDILCDLDGRKVGIELTRFFHHQALVGDQDSKRKLIEIAKNKCEELNNESYSISFLYKRTWRFDAIKRGREAEYDSISEKIVSFVIEVHDDAHYDDRIAYDYLERYGLSEIFDMVWFSMDRNNNWEFDNPVVYDYSAISDDNVLSAINACIVVKERKFDTYIKASKLDECWLLIYYYGDAVSDIDFTKVAEQDIQHKVSENRFAKVLLYDWNYSGRLFNLK